MTHDGMRRRNKNYGDSPVRRSSLPIASSRLASSTRGTASRLPFGSTVESWPPQPSACPRPSPHAVPRIDDASRESDRAPPRRSSEAFSSASDDDVGGSQRDARAAQSTRLTPRRSREETPRAPRRTLLARSTGRGQLARPARHDGSADSWVAGSASLPRHLRHADHAPG